MAAIYRPTKPNLFSPCNPEYALCDALVAEQYTINSPEILWWSLLRDGATGAAARDELDAVYGEKSSGDHKLAYAGPFDFRGFIDISPIVQELTRLGLQQINEIELYANIAATDVYLGGRLPKGGDVFRVTWIVTETERYYVWYKVANVTPVDPYNFRYINWHINAEQTNLWDVPESISNYTRGE